MGAILVTYKVFPEDIVKDFEPLKTEIIKILPETSKIDGWGEEPVAFGLVALLVQIRFPEDVSGVVDDFEVELGKIKGVSQVQTFQIRRTSRDY
ncbi:MAG: elongation factor 1-beta [Candidatus Bathyarchaeota archaeon]|jgi:translation elongation factor aEF-1 beta|nr:elongation factor 1-beta [Candidatus Termiticorpusculum sp.]MCL1971236.1 elongation factor 1-beta [Candidatus Termiticorpusculum sp.]